MKPKSPLVFNLTLDQLEERDKKIRQEMIEEAFSVAMGIPLIVLRDQYGFGTKRMEDFMNHVHETREAIENGNVGFEDLIDTVQKETGVDVYR